MVRPTTATRTSIDVNWISSVRGRVGVLVSPTLLAYATGGFAWGDVDYFARANNEPDIINPDAIYIARTSFSKRVGGYAVGGGLEWAFTRNWLLRSEYLYEHLNTGRSTVAAASFGNFPNRPSRFRWSDTDVHTIRGGVSYKF